MRSFYAKVQFTDANGVHEAGSIVNLPYESDEDIANAQSMVRYGIVTEQAPASTLRFNAENEVWEEAPAPQGPLLPNEENAVNPEGEPVQVTVHDHEVGEEDPQPGGDQPEANALAKEIEAEQAVAKDDPETEHFDARGADGQFVKEGTPIEEPAAEEPAPAPAKKAPAKKATRRKR